MSSIRSSVKRKIQPKEDIMQQSYSELDGSSTNKFMSGYTQNQSSFNNRSERNTGTTLPDIVGEQSFKNSSQNPTKSSTLNNKKPNDNGLCVLGYEDVRSAPVHPKVRQELDYLDREELLHVIAYQSDLLKKRDTRLKDLENYTDTLLVKILEECPTILQVGVPSSRSSYR